MRFVGESGDGLDVMENATNLSLNLHTEIGQRQFHFSLINTYK